MMRVIEPLELPRNKEPTLGEVRKVVREEYFQPNLGKAFLFLFSGVLQLSVVILFSSYVWNMGYWLLFPFA